MANRSYLCGTNEWTIYPSFAQKESRYNPDKQLIANDVWCIPLLWMALFRPKNVYKHTFKTDDGSVYVEAPLAKRDETLTNLRAALPFFNELFKKEGPLDGYVDYLHQAIKACSCKYVTVEMEEIASLNDETEFYRKFRKVLAGIDDQPRATYKEMLIDFAQFRDLKRFPPAGLRRDIKLLKKASDDDHWNHCRVCGAGLSESGYGRPVPWEPKP